MKILRIVISIIIALGVGFIGLSLLFSDLGPAETIQQRLYITEGIYFAAGLAVGLITPEWWWLAGITAWGGVLLAIGGLFGGTDIRLALIFGVASLIPTFLGGFLGAQIRKRRLVQRLFHRG